MASECIGVRGWKQLHARCRSIVAGAGVRTGAVRTIGGLGMMALSGCAHDGFVPTLPYAIPARFAETSNSKPARLSRWWSEFHSVELDRLVAHAGIDNLDIAVAVAQVEAAEAQAHIAGAPLWPAINFADNSSRSRGSGTGTPGVITSPPTRNSFSRVFSASYGLDVWGQNRDLLAAALHNAAASAYQVEVVRLTAQVSVVDRFLIYAASRERLEVANRNLANAERIAMVIRERKAAGTASEFDSAQQGTLVESQRANIPLLRQVAETARTAIALAIGKPVQAVNLKIRSLRQLRAPAVTPGIPSSLLVRRPDIRAAEQQLAATDADVQAARKAFLPTAQLTGQIGYQSALLSTLFRPESLITSFAANIAQTVFDGGRTRGQLALNQAQRRQLLEAYRKAILSGVVDVENALIAIRETAARETAQRRALELARQAFSLGEERLRQGTIDITALLTTQSTLFQSEDLLIQVRAARLQAVVGLYLALGGDWQEF